ncbi:MAG: DUF3244 domain-containing protein [Bacteroidaceae bacterium]|nr:DUF3244 domain-containing protein [Bacteroidaceae bacterium]
MKRFRLTFLCLLFALLHVQAQRTYTYRPFVEDGKVWTIGWLDKEANVVERIEYYYFDGDTLVNHQPCKRMMSRFSGEEQATYQAAFYEEARRVYALFPDSIHFVLLYDFSKEKALVDVYAPLMSDTVPCLITAEDMATDSLPFKGNLFSASFSVLVNDELTMDNALWMEGIGAGMVPFYNMCGAGDSTAYTCCLLSCKVGDEVLCYEASYMNVLQTPSSGVEYPIDVDGVPTGESKKPKQKIDFTHTVKKQPQREGESVGGTLCEARLYVNMETLFNPYIVTITDPQGQVVYTKQLMTDNVKALDIDFSAFPYGDYTITVESDEYIFTGHFCNIPYDYDGDGQLTVNDVVCLVNIYLTPDGWPTVDDIAGLIDMYLNVGSQ